MASHRDEAFQRFLYSLSNQDWGSGAALVRRAWEAGRGYEIERTDDYKVALGETLDALKEIIRVIDHEQPLGNGHRIREIARIALG